MNNKDLKTRLRNLAPSLSEITNQGYFSQFKEAKEAPAQPENAPVQELIYRIKYVTMIVSLWAHVCLVDGELAQQEEEWVGEMMNQFFRDSDALFPKGSVDHDAVFAELAEAFCAPYPLEEVIEFASANIDLATVFFEEACLIVATDGKLHENESDFLDNLAVNLKLPAIHRQNIQQKYIAALY